MFRQWLWLVACLLWSLAATPASGSTASSEAGYLPVPARGPAVAREPEFSSGLLVQLDAKDALSGHVALAPVGQTAPSCALLVAPIAVRGFAPARRYRQWQRAPPRVRAETAPTY